MNHRSTTTYLRRVLSGESPVAESEFLTPQDAARERFVFGLRRLEGIHFDEFVGEVGFQVEELFGEAIDRFVLLGFLERTGDYLRLTRAGLLISDAMWPELLSPAKPG
jgi:oxygen-independent coproporphyrinogen-3 oxidase